MNYIWELIIHAENKDIEIKNINFLHANVYSPYMELSSKEINFTDIEKKVEINPYYRYDNIFQDMFNINYIEVPEYREKLLDITIHFLTSIDRWSGMYKEEFYKKFILKDINKGFLGENIKKNFNLFKAVEKKIIVNNLYKLYKTGDTLYFFKETIQSIFINSIIYVNYDKKNELLIYLNYEENDENLQKIDVIKDLFLPLQFGVILYWKYHFGVIEVEETMKIEEILIY